MGFSNHNLIMFLTPYVEMELQQKPTLILEAKDSNSAIRNGIKSAVLLQRREI